MSKIQKEQELEALLKSSRDRVEAKESIQSSFNAFNDFINIADKKLNDKLDLFENTLESIQIEQNKAIKKLHKETIQETLKEEFKKEISNQFDSFRKIFFSLDQKFTDNDIGLTQRYRNLYKEHVSAILFRSWYGLVYMFYILVCVGSLVIFFAIDDAIKFSTLKFSSIIYQVFTMAIITLIPLFIWFLALIFFEKKEKEIYLFIEKIATIGFLIGFCSFFLYVYIAIK